MPAQISSYSMQLLMSRMINQNQTTLARFSEQLGSGIRSHDLTQYTASEASKILDFRNIVSKSESYIAAINNVTPRLDVYGQALAGMSDIVSQVLRLTDVGSAEEAESISVGTQIEGYVQQVEYFLNQKVGDRYIFAGARYTTAPVGDILGLALPPSGTYPVTSNTLPPYDSQAPGTSTPAWAQSTVTINDAFTATYGIRSTETGIQELVQGLRWVLAALDDPSNYAAYIANARTELDAALIDIRALEGNVAANKALMQQVKEQHQKIIIDTKNNIADIQNVDINEVATKVTFYKTQLEASYSVTARLASLSILNYLA